MKQLEQCVSRVVMNSGRQRIRVAVNGAELNITEGEESTPLHDERIIAVRGIQLHLESHQRDVTDGMQSFF